MVGWTHTGYAQRIIFGLDAIDGVDDVVKEAEGRRVMLVTTTGRRQSEAGERLAGILGRRLVAVFDGVRSHVPTTAVQEALRLAESEDIDAIVSFGGGSCADLGKAVCFFTEQRVGRPGRSFLDRPTLAHVAIPTTYSGAELTPFFGMTDEAAHRKSGAGGPTIAPVAAIYDPVVTLSTPARVAAETGMNALAHGVECAYSPARTPEAEAIALAAVRRVATALPSVIDDPASLAARTAMLEGAVLGGRCLQNATMGAHHGLAQLLGGRTGLAHGLANAILLAHVLRWNAEAVPAAAGRIGEALAEAAQAAGHADSAAAGHADSAAGHADPVDAADAVDRLRRRVGLPGRLSDVGVTPEDIDAVVCMSSSNASVGNNPRPVSPEDARSILESAF
ncbi:MAG: iron-containing alcohol dehydrogenase family protein [Actinomycetota bacterium]|nr:iron-containing alcohol dehydrogenase family protein [Actinomycetota bacterium]